MTPILAFIAGLIEMVPMVGPWMSHALGDYGEWRR